MTVVLAGLAFATSIDALIVGISLGLLELNLFMAAGIIGFTAQVLSLS
jgi:putative Mn2+ efflux pump MntP